MKYRLLRDAHDDSRPNVAGISFISTDFRFNNFLLLHSVDARGGPSPPPGTRLTVRVPMLLKISFKIILLCDKTDRWPSVFNKTVNQN